MNTRVKRLMNTIVALGANSKRAQRLPFLQARHGRVREPVEVVRISGAASHHVLLLEQQRRLPSARESEARDLACGPVKAGNPEKLVARLIIEQPSNRSEKGAQLDETGRTRLQDHQCFIGVCDGAVVPEKQSLASQCERASDSEIRSDDARLARDHIESMHVLVVGAVDGFTTNRQASRPSPWRQRTNGPPRGGSSVFWYSHDMAAAVRANNHDFSSVLEGTDIHAATIVERRQRETRRTAPVLGDAHERSTIVGHEPVRMAGIDEQGAARRKVMPRSQCPHRPSPVFRRSPDDSSLVCAHLAPVDVGCVDLDATHRVAGMAVIENLRAGRFAARVSAAGSGLASVSRCTASARTLRSRRIRISSATHE